MDTTAQRARDREAFREFLEKHRYAPQGRFARVGPLEDKDLDALGRGTLGPVWAWVWQNIKNADDMEVHARTIQRNVTVARYSIDSCKQEREEAKAKRETLLRRKQQLEESLCKAREREQALLASVRSVEDEQETIVASSRDKKQRELLRKAFNDKNDRFMREASGLVDQVQWLSTAACNRTDTSPADNSIDVLLAEFKRMLKSTKNAENVEFGNSDIEHLRASSGAQLLQWILEVASRPLEEAPDDEEDAKYAAHVEEHSSSSHDALVQIQNLLRESQAEHIARFIKTQKVYAKVNELKKRVNDAMAPENAQFGLWGNGDTSGGGDGALAAETADLQIQSQVTAVALNYATRACDDVAKQVETHYQQKHELQQKIELMNQFDERQQDIVAQIRLQFRHNKELIESLTKKQTRLLQIMTNETRPRAEQESEVQLATWSKLVLDELRAFSSLRLGRLDTATKELIVSQDAIADHARQAVATVPFEEFYIHQIQDQLETAGSVLYQQDRNGYQRLARTLGVPSHANWALILESLQQIEGEHMTTPEEIQDEIKNLERDIAEDRSQSIPAAQALLAAVQQVTDAMTTVSLSRLEDVVHVNTETIQQSVPELDQAIDNWYNQPAWGVKLVQPEEASTKEMDVRDLRK